MGLSVKELTDLSEQTAKARRNLDNLLDFVDLMNNDANKLEGDVTPAGEHIKKLSNDMTQYVEEIKIYHGNIHQIISMAGTQKSKHKENSYWWRYWVSVLDNVMQLEIENPSKPVGKGTKFLEKIK